MQEGSVAIKKLKDEENYMKILGLFLIRLQELNPGHRAASPGTSPLDWILATWGQLFI